MTDNELINRIVNLFETKGDAKAIKAIKDYVEATKKGTDTIEKDAKAHKEQSKELEKSTSAFSNISKQILQVERDLKKYYAAKSRGLKLSGDTTKSIASLEKQYSAAGGSVKQLKDKQNALSQEWTFSNPLISKVNKSLNQMRWAMVNVAFAAAAVAGAFAPFVVLGKWGAEMELLFTRIQVVTGEFADIAAKNIAVLRNETMFSLEEMGTGYLEFTKQGFSSAEAMKAMTDIANLSVVGFTDMGTAVSMVSQVLHAFNMDASESAHIVDILSKAANESRADVDDFGIALAYAAPVAAQAGISFEETAAALAILTNKGLTASKAGTSLAAMMTMMLKPTEDTKKAMRDIGLSFFDAEGKMKSLDQVTQEWAYTLDDSEESLAFLYSAMGRRGGRAMANFLNEIRETGITLADFTEQIDEAGYAQERAAQIADTTTMRIKTAWNDLKASFVPIAGGISDLVGNLVEAFTELGEKVGDPFEDIVASGDRAKASLNFHKQLYQAQQRFEKNRQTNKFQEAGLGVLNIASITFTGKTIKTPETKAKEAYYEEEKRLYEEYNKAIEAINKKTENEEERHAKKMETIRQTNLNAFRNNTEDFISAANKQLEIKQVSDLQSLSDLIGHLNDKAVAAGQDATVYKKLMFGINESIVKARQLSEELSKWEKLSDNASKSIASLNRELKEENSILSDLKENLSDVTSDISELSSPRFNGQLEAETLIQNIERFIKKQKLADYGIIDSQEFLQDALSKSKDGYEDLINSVNKYDDAVSSNQDTYEAWRETVKEFIRSTVEEGNLLGENVSGAINKYSSLLLQTSKFGDEQGQQTQYLSLLRDAYDVYYGGMTDEVKNAVMAHEEAGMTIYGTAQQVINALQIQWEEQTKLTRAVEKQESVVGSLNSEMDIAQQILADYRAEITETTKELNSMVNLMWKISRSSIETGKYSGGNGNGESVNLGGKSWYSNPDLVQTPSGAWTTPQNDFVMRPGQKPVPFSSEDTIIGTKGGVPGNISIGNLVLHGASGDPQEFAYKLAKEIRREMAR